jgi:protein-disulfide isomerase
VLFWRYSTAAWIAPSVAVVATAAVVVGGGAYGVRLYHDARRDAQFGGAATRIVRQYYSLAPVQAPSVISPYWVLKATDRFEDAPIRIVAYEDLLCPDCKLLGDQIKRLEAEFAGKINMAFQFFPLEAKCNQVVAKDLHPGACDLAYIAAQDPAKFRAIYDEAFANIRDAREPAWREALARKHGVEAGFTDQKTHDLVSQILNTGAEYEKTSDQYAHGIRSTPTMIINGRMVIGTLPYEQLRALFQTLVDESAEAGSGFLERWVPAADRARQTGPAGR